MKPVSANITKTMQPGTYLKCIDNTGADLLQVITVKNYKGVKRRRAFCGIGDVIVAAVKKGTPKMRHEVVEAVVVRQTKEYKRPNGLRVCFEDNAAVLINERGEPRGTRLKGPIAKETVERFSAIGKIASMIA
ncbi:MAG: 50S ribosomal protein L14 [Candidatus Aenigmatarchaeota archaeon]